MTERTPPSSPTLFSTARLWKDWRVLAETIGERRAGTAAERRAADFIRQRFVRSGLRDVRLESFPCTSLRSSRAEVHEWRRGRWRGVEANSLVGAPGTPDGEAVEGDAVWLELPEAGDRVRTGGFRGRILVIFGCLPTSAALHRRILAAQPLAVVHVDDRLPFSWTKNDGVYPYWTQKYGMPPTVTVPYADAWRWRRDGVRRLRVRVRVKQVAAASHNVVAELSGSDRDLPALALTAHHDTQCGNPGADDNASGVVCLLALARALAGSRLRRTVRFLSFGTEEQLSVGSSAYVAAHRPSPREIGLVVNFDSVSSPLGHVAMSVAGSGRLARHARLRLAEEGLDVAARQEITPFSDHFPFNLAGISSLFFTRENFPGGRWQHHSPHDTLSNVSAAEVARLLHGVHPLLCDLASSATWPFGARLAPRQHALALRIGRELFGPVSRGLA